MVKSCFPDNDTHNLKSTGGPGITSKQRGGAPGWVGVLGPGGRVICTKSLSKEGALGFLLGTEPSQPHLHQSIETKGRVCTWGEPRKMSRELNGGRRAREARNRFCKRHRIYKTNTEQGQGDGYRHERR